MPEKILEVKNLNIEYDGRKIVKDVSFEVNRGEVLVILGPNGAGKTTLLKSLIGRLPYQGEVKWYVDDINYLPPQELFERKNLPPLSVEEFFNLKDVSGTDIINILEDVGLESSILDQGFGNLSTGQFQRMVISWALVDEPSVLLFDEPTAGIDLGGQETIYSLLHKFWKERTLTILLVTHDMSIVWEHANDVLCLNRKKLCSGKPEKVLTPEKLEELYGAGIEFYRHDHGRSACNTS
ncbi:ABC transporter ATP-binding protein [candidate division MSBL1 archaeon SCGC-AAA382C18]|uniref:ABC transporter ATP-binding protein n=1 Tax=candidate division MSBL1 archaeon SCGC-AAA382C18 TaxID=1698281 RepID=A0A133VJ60_9EURY|nr:ABC transporter ATP-binding protein [candidate division MSBL1 archaeon SCGC-AAA382C18]